MNLGAHGAVRLKVVAKITPRLVFTASNCFILEASRLYGEESVPMGSADLSVYFEFVVTRDFGLDFRLQR